MKNFNNSPDNPEIVSEVNLAELSKEISVQILGTRTVLKNFLDDCNIATPVLQTLQSLQVFLEDVLMYEEKVLTTIEESKALIIDIVEHFISRRHPEIVPEDKQWLFTTELNVAVDWRSRMLEALDNLESNDDPKSGKLSLII